MGLGEQTVPSEQRWESSTKGQGSEIETQVFGEAASDSGRENGAISSLESCDLAPRTSTFAESAGVCGQWCGRGSWEPGAHSLPPDLEVCPA